MSAAPTPVKAPERLAPARVVTPVKPAPKKPWGWVLLGVVIIAVIGTYVWRSNAAKEQAKTASVAAVRTATVMPGTFEKHLRIAGQTSARQFANVNAPILRGPEAREMVITEVVPSGSLVKKGQVIAKVDGQSLIDHIDDLKDTIEAADADVRKAKADQMIEWETLQQTLRLTKAEYEKARLDASAADVRTDVERQLLQLALEEAEAKYKQQQEDLKFKQQSMQAQVRILELTRERHTRHRNRHLVDLEKFTIHAAMDGLAVMSQIWRGGEMGQFQQGDRVFPGQLFMKVVNTNSMQLEATVNQTESGSVRIGQQASLKLDAFPGLELPAKIHSIGALAVGGWRQNYYIRTVPVIARIEGRDSRLIPDLSASADVLVTREENKLLVPLSGITERNGKTYARVKTGDQFVEREVQLGDRNTSHAIVLAGLEPKDEVQVN